jgi:hypothetical protein
MSTFNGSVKLPSVTADPGSPVDGQIWYRSDTDLFRGRINGVTRTIDTVAVATPSDTSGTISTDASLGNHFRVTLTGTGRTLANPTNPFDGQKIVYEFIQDGTGSRTITTWGSNFAFGTDVTQPTLTTTANKRDFVGFVYNATAGKWYCLAVAKGY